MKSAVVVFPGSNCDRDIAAAIEQVTGRAPAMVWHRDSELPQGTDFIALPGGFSYGDYLRSGAMAARSPIMQAVVRAAERGVPVLGVCNGFQVLTEAGLLPGALMRNAGQMFVCRTVPLRVEIRLRGGEAEVDFAGTAAQVPGPVNAVASITRSAVFYVFRCLAPDRVPNNHGAQAPIRVLVPPGSVLDAGVAYRIAAVVDVSDADEDTYTQNIQNANFLTVDPGIIIAEGGTGGSAGRWVGSSVLAYPTAPDDAFIYSSPNFLFTTIVPEPASFALLGLGGVVGLARRRKA